MPVQTKLCFLFQEAPGAWTPVYELCTKGVSKMLTSGNISFNRQIRRHQPSFVFWPLWPSSTQLLPQVRGDAPSFLQESPVGISALLSYFLGCVVVSFHLSHQVSLPNLSLPVYKHEGLFSNSGTLRSMHFADEESLREMVK